MTTDSAAGNTAPISADAAAASVEPRRADLSRAAASRWLLVILMAALALRVGFANGWAASDDWLYHSVATRLSTTGTAQLGDGVITYDNRAARVSWILTVTGWLAMFGDSEAAMAALDIVFGVLSVAALYWVAREIASRRVALTAAALLAVYPPAVIYNGLLFPDHFGQFWMLLTIAAFLAGLRARGRERWAWVAVSGVALAVAVSAKEAAVMLGVVLPLLAFFRRRTAAGLAVVALAVVLFVAMELPALRWMHGDAMYRFKASEVSFGEGGISRQVFNPRQLFYYPGLLLLRVGLLGPFGWALAAGAVWALVRRRRFAAVLAWTLAFWAFLEFGSSTLSHYSPLPKEPRLMAPITALLFIPLADLLARGLSARGAGRAVSAIALAVLMVSGVLVAGGQSRTLYRSDYKLALRRAVALHAEGQCPALILPNGVVDRAPPGESTRYAELPTIDLVGAGLPEVAPERMLFDARGMAMVVPASHFAWMRMHGMFHAVKPTAYHEFLTAHARVIPLHVNERPIDRFLGRVGLPSVCVPQVAGHLYVLPD